MKKFLLLIITAMAAVSCKTFIPENDVPLLTEFEKQDYVLLQDVSSGKSSLKKNTFVKILTVSGDSWVKVYAYDRNQTRLESERVLVLYLFSDDFKEEEFNVDYFRDRLYRVLKPVTKK